ncbi:U6 small nuclear RNA (adenine-(43)-N(6))-methyltransferase [Calliphora vicina]|uniref:U6 small nuclear RNA (adenine-(43)-N(6))-methyltransferase n=1 Tax=Calliphora vicina TaxID=7373 RepID=UPI00325A79E5
MHPRNIFKQPPDYTELAIKYPEFRRVCKLELTGKVCIDYKNETALRALTQTLLLEYFQLSVAFAPGSLVPTLPLRLNYILWLEDVLQTPCTTNYPIKGIDIGCGSSCIYSLLAAKKNNWQMVALESNATNLQFAGQNIENNKLETLITLYPQQDKTQIFQEYFKHLETSSPGVIYDFCLCNPPFFDSQSEANNKTRKSGKRPPPHNCPTGYKEELSCQGGEVKFVQQIIEESLLFKEKIRVFTSMLGLKSSLMHVLNILKSKDIDNFCSTEFHQGNTTRWGVAWSYDGELDLKKFQ